MVIQGPFDLRWAAFPGLRFLLCSLQTAGREEEDIGLQKITSYGSGLETGNTSTRISFSSITSHWPYIHSKEK